MQLRHRVSPTMRRSLLAAIAAALLAALIIVTNATANTYGWQGRLPGGSNGVCPWYASWGHCGPSQTNWYRNNGANQNPSGDGLHVGFENSSAIRGMYLGSYQSGSVYASDVFSSGTAIRPELTWCHWLPECGTAGWADGWYSATT